jgi:DNA-binding CsgD family transcriptional regulator
LLLVAPPPARAAEAVWRAEPAAAIFITDPDSQAGTPAERLAALFGLTPAEARLAVSLAAGASLDETANAFGLSKLTLRTQLRILLDKTGTNRQAALVRMLSRIAGY